MTDSTWSYYKTPGDAWDAMYEACAAAEKTIDFEQYIFEPHSRAGKKFLKLFRQKAKQGVRVRLLADMAGSFRFYFSPVRFPVWRSGIDLRFYNPIRYWRIGSSCGIFPRDHRKITVVDGSVAFTGGVCIDESMRDWRDTHVKIVGPVVDEVQYTFDSIWKNTGRDACHTRIPPFQSERENTLWLNEPAKGNHLLRDKILKRLAKAESRIWITTPYFVPAGSFRRVIVDALERGVEVKIMTSGHCNPISYTLGKEESGEFLRLGATVYSYCKCMLHTKTLLVDDNFLAVGSFNVDSLSFYHNQEADIISSDPEVVREFERHFEEDAQHSRKLSYEDWLNRHWCGIL